MIQLNLGDSKYKSEKKSYVYSEKTISVSDIWPKVENAL